MISIREDFEVGTASPFQSEVEGIFSETGILSGAASFEYRAEQQRMAGAVARTIETGGHLVVEAGTGVGKSLAYLVPAALHAVRTKRKAVICTHTIALQEQLMFKDIPLVQKIVPDEFEAVLLKGRQNYFCTTRLARALTQSKELFTTPQHAELGYLHTDVARGDLLHRMRLIENHEVIRKKKPAGAVLCVLHTIQ